MNGKPAVIIHPENRIVVFIKSFVCEEPACLGNAVFNRNLRQPIPESEKQPVKKRTTNQTYILLIPRLLFR